MLIEEGRLDCTEVCKRLGALFPDLQTLVSAHLSKQHLSPREQLALLEQVSIFSSIFSSSKAQRRGCLGHHFSFPEISRQHNEAFLPWRQLDEQMASSFQSFGKMAYRVFVSWSSAIRIVSISGSYSKSICEDLPFFSSSVVGTAMVDINVVDIVVVGISVVDIVVVGIAVVDIAVIDIAGVETALVDIGVVISVEGIVETSVTGDASVLFVTGYRFIALHKAVKDPIFILGFALAFPTSLGSTGPIFSSLTGSVVFKDVDSNADFCFGRGDCG